MPLPSSFKAAIVTIFNEINESILNITWVYIPVMGALIIIRIIVLDCFLFSYITLFRSLSIITSFSNNELLALSLSVVCLFSVLLLFALIFQFSSVQSLSRVRLLATP